MKSKLVYVVGFLIVVITGIVVISVYLTGNDNDESSPTTSETDNQGDIDEIQVIGDIPDEAVISLGDMTEDFENIIFRRVDIDDVQEYYLVRIDGDFLAKVRSATEHLTEIEENLSTSSRIDEYIHFIAEFTHRDLDRAIGRSERTYQLHTWANGPDIEWESIALLLVAPADHPILKD